MSNTPVAAQKTEPKVYGRVDINKALKLRFKNDLSYQEIGKQLGVTGDAVHKRLKKFKKLLSDPAATKAYEENKANFLSAAEQELLVHLVDDKKIKDASLNNVAYAFQQVSNFNRLAQDKSTSNLDIRSMQLHSQNELEASVKARDALLKQLEVGDDPQNE